MFLEVKFEGGLGNQLFQYAAARSLCIKNKITYLLLNTDSYKSGCFTRYFTLSNLQIKGAVIKNKWIKKLFHKHTRLNKIAATFSLHKNITERNFQIHQLEKKNWATYLY